MSVRNEFIKTINAVEQVLEQPGQPPREIRNSIKALITAYQAQDVVQQSFKNFDNSGVLQWRNFLRAANVRDQEGRDEYIGRIRTNLDEVRRFEVEFLRGKALTV